MALQLVASAASAALSFGIVITPLDVSPILLMTAVGAVLMAWLGRGTWPAFLVGDIVGEALATDRALALIALAGLLHTLIALAAATWIARYDAWPGDLRTSVRYLLGAAAISVIDGLLFGVATHALGTPGGGSGLQDEVLLAIVGVLVGFLVAGTLLLAWLRRPAACGPWRGPAAGLVAISVAAALGLAGPVGVAVPIALLGSLLLTATSGRRWGSLGMVAITITALIGAERGGAPMGGDGTTEAIAHIMVTLALFGGFTLLLGGYRSAGAATSRPVATTALLFAGMMLVAGIAGVASNEVVVTENSPLVIAGVFTTVSALGLLILRRARPVEKGLQRRGFLLAMGAGGLYALNLALLFAAMPLIGAGAATALGMISPLPVVVLSIIFLGLRPTWWVGGAVLIIVVGALVAALGSLDDPAGIALAVLSAVAFGGSVVITRAALRSAGILDVALVSAATAAVLALVMGAIISGPSTLLLSQQEIRVIALAALGAQLVPILGRTWALQHMGTDLVGAEGVLAPATTALLSFWLISPASSASQWVGLVIIGAGAVLAALAAGRVPRTTAMGRRRSRSSV
jgi:drug/metabolite transporter (DMT)-like permease